jgi:hypothetical protein
MSDLVKSLTELIDETLNEIESLKKSKFDASKIDLGDDKANGSLDTCSINKKEDDEDKDDEKKEDKKDDKDEDKKDDKKFNFEKSDDKDEDDKEDDEDEEVAKAEAALCAAKEKAAMKKAEKKGVNVEKAEDFQKSLNDQIAPLQAQINQLTDLVKKMADTPVAQRGSSFKDIQPLKKSESTEPLNKSQVLNKLFDLKKSGADVASNDIIRAEVGSNEDLNSIANKYGIK